MRQWTRRVWGYFKDEEGFAPPHDTLRGYFDEAPPPDDPEEAAGWDSSIDRILRIAKEYDSPDVLAESIKQMIDLGPQMPEGRDRGKIAVFEAALEALGKGSGIRPSPIDDSDPPYSPSGDPDPRRDTGRPNMPGKPSKPPKGDSGVGSWDPSRPRTAQREETVGGNREGRKVMGKEAPTVYLHINNMTPVGAWKQADQEEVRDKAKRIYDSDGVKFRSVTPNPDANRVTWDFDVLSVSGNRYIVNGDTTHDDPTGWYDTTAQDTYCTCPWSQWNFDRSPNYKHLEGFPCAHVRAAEMWLEDNGQVQLDRWHEAEEPGPLQTEQPGRAPAAPADPATPAPGAMPAATPAPTTPPASQQGQPQAAPELQQQELEPEPEPPPEPPPLTPLEQDEEARKELMKPRASRDVPSGMWKGSEDNKMRDTHYIWQSGDPQLSLVQGAQEYSVFVRSVIPEQYDLKDMTPEQIMDSYADLMSQGIVLAKESDEPLSIRYSDKMDAHAIVAEWDGSQWKPTDQGWNLYQSYINGQPEQMQLELYYLSNRVAPNHQHPDLQVSNGTATIYRGVYVQDLDADPTETTKRDTGGMGDAWTASEEVARKIAERMGAGFVSQENFWDETAVQRVRRDSDGRFKSMGRPVIYRGQVPSDSGDATLDYVFMQLMSYTHEQEVDVPRGTQIYLDAYKDADARRVDEISDQVRDQAMSDWEYLRNEYEFEQAMEEWNAVYATNYPEWKDNPYATQYVQVQWIWNDWIPVGEYKTANYIDDAIEKLREELDGEEEKWGDDGDVLLQLYTLLSLAKGDEVTEEDVHSAWAIWESNYGDPNHEDIVPFDELDEEEQEKDAPYAEVIEEVSEDLEGGSDGETDRGDSNGGRDDHRGDRSNLHHDGLQKEIPLLSHRRRLLPQHGFGSRLKIAEGIDPELDVLLQEYTGESVPVVEYGSGETKDLPVAELSDPSLAEGYCGDVARHFKDWLKARGISAWVNIGTAEIYGSPTETHVWVETEAFGGNKIIDWTASQFGVDDLPVVIDEEFLKEGMAQRSGNQKLDLLIDEFLYEAVPGYGDFLDMGGIPDPDDFEDMWGDDDEWGAEPEYRVKDLKHPDLSEGRCDDVSCAFASFLEDNGLEAEVRTVPLDNFPGGTGFAEPGMEYTEYEPHVVVEVDVDGETYQVDFTASQFGEPYDEEFPAVFRKSDEGWQSKWSKKGMARQLSSYIDNVKYGVTTKTASILSPVRDTLAPDVWEDEESLLPEVRDYILLQAYKMLSKDWAGIDGKDYLKTIWLIGSITGYQYDDDADLDVNIGFDTERLVDEGHFRDEEDAKDFIRQHIIDFNDAGDNILPGTEHPVNFLLKSTKGPPPADGIYDVVNEEWLKKPGQGHNMNFDPSQEYASAVNKAEYLAEEIDKWWGIMKRAEKMRDYPHTGRFYEEMWKKAVIKINKIWSKIWSSRVDAFELAKADPSIRGNDLPANIIYKYMERNGYLDKLHEANHTYDDRIKKSAVKQGELRQSILMRIFNEVKKGDNLDLRGMVNISDRPLSGFNKIVGDGTINIFWNPIEADGTPNDDGYPFHAHVLEALKTKLNTSTGFVGRFANGGTDMVGTDPYTADIWTEIGDGADSPVIDTITDLLSEAQRLTVDSDVMWDNTEQQGATQDTEFKDGDQVTILSDGEQYGEQWSAGDIGEFVSLRGGSGKAWIQLQSGMMVQIPRDQIQKVSTSSITATERSDHSRGAVPPENALKALRGLRGASEGILKTTLASDPHSDETMGEWRDRLWDDLMQNGNPVPQTGGLYRAVSDAEYEAAQSSGAFRPLIGDNLYVSDDPDRLADGAYGGAGGGYVIEFEGVSPRQESSKYVDLPELVVDEIPLENITRVWKWNEDRGGHTLLSSRKEAVAVGTPLEGNIYRGYVLQLEDSPKSYEDLGIQAEEMGIYWTDDYEIAKQFATRQLGMGTRGNYGVVIEAEVDNEDTVTNWNDVPPQDDMEEEWLREGIGDYPQLREHFESDDWELEDIPEEWREGWAIQRGYSSYDELSNLSQFGFSEVESEITLRPGANLNIVEVEVFKDFDGSWERVLTMNPEGMSVTAAELPSNPWSDPLGCVTSEPEEGYVNHVLIVNGTPHFWVPSLGGSHYFKGGPKHDDVWRALKNKGEVGDETSHHRGHVNLHSEGHEAGPHGVVVLYTDSPNYEIKNHVQEAIGEFFDEVRWGKHDDAPSTKLAEEKYSGAMVALVPPREIAEKLAELGNEPVDNIHLTLAYLPSAPSDENHIIDDLEEWAKNHPEPLGKISGFGTFVNEGENVLWASIDIPEGDNLRHSISEMLEEEQYVKDLDEMHWFQPHITLDYGDKPFDSLPDMPDGVQDLFPLKLIYSDKNNEWTEISWGNKTANLKQPMGGWIP